MTEQHGGSGRARPDPADLPWRRGVGVVLFNRDGLVFVGRRIDTATPAWQMPQGGVDEGEDWEAAARRELREEIGTDHVRFIDRTEKPLRYDLPPELVGRVWGGRYRGQEQHWFAARFLGRDADIRLDASPHPEFSQWRWMPLEETVARIVPFKRRLYAELARRFARHARPMDGGGDGD